MPEYIVIITSFLSGGLAGSVITLVVSGRRDKRQRRRSFLAFLHQWKTKICLPSQVPDMLRARGLGTNAASDCYYSELPSFSDEAALARDAFSDPKSFGALTKSLGSLKPETLSTDQARQMILNAIDNLLAFVESN